MDQNLKDEIKLAAQYAYFGGRFETFKIGRYKGPVYSLDINSAYPFAISQLPNLNAGALQISRVKGTRPLCWTWYTANFLGSATSVT